jgi:hypothetical protein
MLEQSHAKSTPTILKTYLQGFTHIGYFQEQSLAPFTHDIENITSFLKSHSLAIPSHEALLHAWLCGTTPPTINLVNTRCVYYHHEPLPAHHEDNMTLAPLIDMINHSSDENVSVSRVENALEIRASRIIDTNEEIAFSYHSASSRFWVCEYGFYPFDNDDYNNLDISGEIEEGTREPRRKWLEDNGYWGLFPLEADIGNIPFRILGYPRFGLKLPSWR